MTDRIADLPLEQLGKKRRLIIRDDYYDLPELRDVLEAAAGKKIKVVLLDTGRFTPAELELLADFPFSFYTSDLARPDFQDLNHINLSLKARGCGLFYYLQGELKEDSGLSNETELPEAIYVSDREADRPLELLARLAEEVSRSRSTLVYYHHKKLEENLARVCLKNCWLHISNQSFDEEAEIMITDLMREIQKDRGRLVVHINRGQSYHFLRRLADSGAFLVFNLPPLEPASSMFSLVEGWRKKKLPEKSYYLYREIMA